jgi:hypothetical protein
LTRTSATPSPTPPRAARGDTVDVCLDLIDAAVYGDLFDCAVTAEELWRYSRIPIGREEFWRRIADNPALGSTLRERDGLYCIVGRDSLLDLRPKRRERATKLQRRARLVARLLRHVPFVRGLFLTGSAGAEDAPHDADVDLLVLVKPGRLAIVFTVLGILSRLISRRVFCPNHYLSTANVALDGRRDLYVAREVVQAYPLTGEADALRVANAWVDSLLPNSSTRHARSRPLPGGRVIQRLLEWPMRGRLGDTLERALGPLALARLRNHHGRWDSSVPADVIEDFESGIQLRFHGPPENQSVIARYERRREEIAAHLE